MSGKTCLILTSVFIILLMISPADAGEWTYYVRDHLGSTRVVIDDDCTVKEYYTYFPFGLEIDGWCSIAGDGKARFKFTGKELDDEDGLGWYYFGARYYNPEVGIWLTPDPAAGKYPSLSPYSYAANNPLKYIDPNGEELKAVLMKGLTSSDTELKDRVYYLDTKIADKAVAFANEARDKFSQISVNNTFRVGASSLLKTKNIKAKGLSRHQAGFAIDLNSVSKLTTEELKELNEIAKKHGFYPLKDQQKDLPHFSADPTDYGYESLEAAVDENQKDYERKIQKDEEEENENE